MYIGPLVFAEIYKPKPWGGKALARTSGKELPAGGIGESWEISDHPNGISVVRGGPMDGRSLRGLMQRHRRSLVGERAVHRFPLIVKLIDAGKRLSVQVHPDDEQAKCLGLKDSGKTEAWYVLDGRANASLVIGLKSDKYLPVMVDLALSGELASRLRAVRPEKGQSWVCEPGSLHALGPGLVMLEIQQNSDATLRLYDWGRRPRGGVQRPLHLKECLTVVGDGMSRVRRVRPIMLKGLPFPAKRLAATECFVMDKWLVSRQARRSKSNKFETLHVLSGEGRLSDGRWPEIELTRGRTVLIPADVAAYDIVPSRRMEIIRAAEPED